jgi:hypothetical protein
MIISVIIRSLATPYAGPHKLFKSFLKLPCCIFTVAERKQLRDLKSKNIVQRACEIAKPLNNFFQFHSSKEITAFDKQVVSSEETVFNEGEHKHSTTGSTF